MNILTPDKVGGWKGSFVRDTPKFLILKIGDGFYHVSKKQLILDGWWYLDQPLKKGLSIDADRRLWNESPGGHVWCAVSDDYKVSDGKGYEEDISI